MTETDSAILAAHRLLEDDGGLRRTLRRIGDRTEALYHEGTHAALAHLHRAGMRDLHRRLDALLLMSHVETHASGRLGRQLRSGGVRPERFRRLALADRPEALEQLRYMVQQCKGRVSAIDLAWTAYKWDADARDGRATAKEELALDYYDPKNKEDTE